MRDGWVATLCLIVFVVGFLIGAQVIDSSAKRAVERGAITIGDKVYRLKPLEAAP